MESLVEDPSQGISEQQDASELVVAAARRIESVGARSIAKLELLREPRRLPLPIATTDVEAVSFLRRMNLWASSLPIASTPSQARKVFRFNYYDTPAPQKDHVDFGPSLSAIELELACL
jgi:hypothetical protein